VSGQTLGEVLENWGTSERRRRFRERLQELDSVDPDDVIMPPRRARERGLTSTVTFPSGNLAPEGAVIKSTAIDPGVLDADGTYRHEGPARVFTRERDAIESIKAGGVQAGDVLILVGCGPSGTGMEETYQLTSALRYLPFGQRVALVTDARFSGVSTGACIGHVGPEALAGGPIGKVKDGDWVRIAIDPHRLDGRVDLVGEGDERFGAGEGSARLSKRAAHPGLAADAALSDDTRLWAALQAVSGGTWGGCVYDFEAIAERLGVPSR
jgi:dihydroxyacid dehydratase/phosphogluconate dehydratase